jgi:hypothetical protein
MHLHFAYTGVVFLKWQKEEKCIPKLKRCGVQAVLHHTLYALKNTYRRFTQSPQETSLLVQPDKTRLS